VSQADLDVVHSTNEALKAQIEALKAKLTHQALLRKSHAKEVEIAAWTKNFRDYRVKYRASIMQKLVGTKVARLATARGPFLDVTVDGFDDRGLRISHSEGDDLLQLEDLEPELRGQLGYLEEDLAELRSEKAPFEGNTLYPPTPPKPGDSLKAKKSGLDKLVAWMPVAEEKLQLLKRETLDLDRKKRYGRRGPRGISYWAVKATQNKNTADALEARIHDVERQVEALRRELASHPRAAIDAKTRELDTLIAWIPDAEEELQSLNEKMREYELKNRYAKVVGRMQFTWGELAAEKKKEAEALETKVQNAKSRVEVLRKEMGSAPPKDPAIEK